MRHKRILGISDKPDSVVDHNFSGRRLPVLRSTQVSKRAEQTLHLYSILLRVGFTKWPVTRPDRELLPHGFTLTEVALGRLVSVALSVGLPRLAVSQHPALRSPDFPQERSSPVREDAAPAVI
jgi:hypothetical protein